MEAVAGIITVRVKPLQLLSFESTSLLMKNTAISTPNTIPRRSDKFRTAMNLPRFLEGVISARTVAANLKIVKPKISELFYKYPFKLAIYSPI